MIKYFCDECESEVDDNHPDMLTPTFDAKIGKWQFLITTTYKDRTNVASLCQPCLRKLLMQAVDEYVKTKSVVGKAEFINLKDLPCPSV